MVCVDRDVYYIIQCINRRSRWVFIKGKYSNMYVIVIVSEISGLKPSCLKVNYHLLSMKYVHHILWHCVRLCYCVGNLRVETSYIIQVNKNLLSMKYMYVLAMCVKPRFDSRSNVKTNRWERYMWMAMYKENSLFQLMWMHGDFQGKPSVSTLSIL